MIKQNVGYLTIVLYNICEYTSNIYVITIIINQLLIILLGNFTEKLFVK